MHNTPWTERLEKLAMMRDSSGHWLWPYREAIRYWEQQTVNVHSNVVWAEILVAHTSMETIVLLDSICKEWKNLFLFQRGLVEAFYQIALWEAWTTWYRAVNTYIADIADPSFQIVVTKVMKSFKRDDKRRVKIEIIETRFGDITPKFIENVIWLKDEGFKVVIDDFDFLWTGDDMSHELLRAIGEYVDGIKIDWKTTQALLRDPALRAKLFWLRDLIQIGMTLEWVQSREQIGQLLDTWADTFQMSWFGAL